MNPSHFRTGSQRPGGGPSDSRFDRRLAEILDHATNVFYEKGYEGASMRDLSRATGMSLAGLYYYFESKEKLLYMVQKHTFATVLQNLEEKLEGVNEPEERIRIFVHNHLDYFLGNRKGMKVLLHESGVLGSALELEIAGIKRQYYRMLRDITEELQRKQDLNTVPARVAALSLFGMMNWIYTWHKPMVDGGPEELAREMSNIFLHGMLGLRRRPPEDQLSPSPPQKPAARKRKAASSKG